MGDRREQLSVQTVGELFARVGDVAAEVQQALGEIDRLREDLAWATAFEEEFRLGFEAAEETVGELEEELERTRASRDEARSQLDDAKALNQELTQQVSDLEQEITALRSDKGVITRERDEARKAAADVRVQCQWELVKDLSPILTKLSALAELEPESVRGLTPRAVFEKMKGWMSTATGEQLAPFPTKEELGDGLILDPDQEGLDALIEQYDWSPEHPFEGLPEGDRSCEFRVLRRGWRAGDVVVARARVTLLEQDG